MKIAVIDGQGGGLGKVVIERLIKERIHEKASLFALGTNGVATSVMLKAGAHEGASGENALVYNLTNTDIIIGSCSILLQNSMLGEITPGMACAILESPACKILVPLKNHKIMLLGLKEQQLPRFLDEMVQKVNEYLLNRGRTAGIKKTKSN
ncbi:DUF3842 family protein [Candidatus Contubernalis alkaliaceticus]|uniref:DUF3842 family protein n=1 Tax=Candidatus Contubernalis alkaliaceticus TaxID=338645 RepID=UPI001F4BED0C|nr:DUF3842 family protein [Candidatus Contubernalis alkalaceticus]UNC93007.1 DUF3842 family protein [Candidatus Contubernalis alkalaceticus]